MADKIISIMNIDRKLNNDINDLCAKKNIDKDSFIIEALENQIIFTNSQSQRLKEKIDELCEDHGMSKGFFYTKALENYCKYLAENDKKE